jgi:thiamine biosynthesis protein ThiI
MIVYRRAMFRIASRIAASERALGYVTGDSLGQVASQTAENLRVIHAAADRPVYAPLIGDDKVEVVGLARRIGTFEISIRPHEDCCSFMVTEHPATRSRPRQVEAAEEGIPWEDLVGEALAGARREVHTAGGSARASEEAGG